MSPRIISKSLLLITVVRNSFQTIDDLLDKENLLRLEQPDCSYFVAMAPNEKDERFLDIYLEGTLPGWVAVGFSFDKKMVIYLYIM